MAGDLQNAIAAALKIGTEFHQLGADLAASLPVGIVMPPDLHRALCPDDLRDHFGITAAEERAVTFFARFGLDIVMVEDAAGYAEAVAKLSDAEWLSIDIETGSLPPPIRIKKDGSIPEPRRGNGKSRKDTDGAGLDPFRATIAMVQLWDGGSEVFLFIREEKDRLLREGWLIERRLVAHNSFFETMFLRQAGVILQHRIECTMHAVSLLYGPPRSLAALCERVFKVTPPKEHGLSYWAAETYSEGQISYAASDTVICWHGADELLPRIHNSRRKTPYELQVNAIPAVVDMRLRGLGFDRTEHARQVDQWRREEAAACLKYREQMNGRGHPKTPAKTIALIEELIKDRPEWQLTPWPLTKKTGQLSTARVNLKRLLPHPGIATLLEIRAKSKLIGSQFGAPLPSYITAATGRLHADYRIAGSITGRMSCSNPNLQQLPSRRCPEYRKVIIPAPGHLLIVGDWNQAELRVFGWLTGCDELNAVFADPDPVRRDIHRATAAAFANIPFDAVTKEQRQAAKPFSFATVYGGGVDTLIETAFDDYGLVLTEDEAAEKLARWFETFPVRGWMDQHAEICQSRGFIEMPSGRIVAPGWMRDDEGLTYARCCNFPTQGTCADATMRGTIAIGHRLPGTLVAIVHDEFVLEVPEAAAAGVAHSLTEIMTETFAETVPGAPLLGLVSTGIGVNWYDAKLDADKPA